MIQAKFTCQEVTKSRHWDSTGRFLYSAKFTAVTNGSEENKQFFAATPNGHLTLGCFLPDAFEPGKEYFLNIVPADEIQTFDEALSDADDRGELTPSMREEWSPGVGG